MNLVLSNVIVVSLVQWSQELAPEVVVMGSMGAYCKSTFAALERVGNQAWIVNVRHVKAVPGRKTDVADAQWLATTKALIQGHPLQEVLDFKGCLRATREERFEALRSDEFSATHRLVAEEIMDHIEDLARRIQRKDQYLLAGLGNCQAQLNLLQTWPGVDQIGAAMLLVETGTDEAP